MTNPLNHNCIKILLFRNDFEIRGSQQGSTNGATGKDGHALVNQILKNSQFWLDFVLRCKFNVIKSLNEHVFHSKIVIECNSKLSIPQELIILMFWQFLDFSKKFLNLGPILEPYGIWRPNSTRGPGSTRGLKDRRVVPDSTDIDPCQNADNDLSIEDAFNHHYYRLYHLSIWPLDFAQKILVHLALVQLSRPDIPFLSI